MKSPGTANWPGFVRRLVAGPGVTLAFFWGFAEATVFFVVPDVLLSLVAAYDGRRGMRHVLAAVAGALVGGAVMYSYAARSPEAARAVVAGVPFVRPAMFERVETEIREQGAMALFRGPLAGVPYKIYAVQAAPHVSPMAFLLMSVPARAARFVLVWLISMVAGLGLRRWFPARPALCACVHGVLWITFYGFYWFRI